MSTIIDLNTARTITYNDEANYAIVFGANAGNITANVDSYATANITQQTTLTSITSPVRDLLLDLQFSNVGNVSMAYAGTYSNIGLLQVAPAAWRVSGIRSVAQYTEAFANVKFSDLTGASNITPEYSYVTTVNDQAGNTRNWTTTVNVIQQPTISITGNVIYNEDTLTNVTIANVVVDPTSIVTFRLFANTAAGNGTMTDGVTTGNSIFIDGNAASLNSQITAGAIKFLPASDLVSNVGNAINFALGNTTAIFSTANANIQIGTVHDEYSLTTSYNYTEDDTKQIIFAITDLDTHATSFTSTFAQASGNTSQFYVNGVAQGYGNSAVITNTKAIINSANVSFLPYPDSTANIGLTYTQVKTTATGNTTQASNIAITMVNTVSHDDYSFAAGTYDEDTLAPFGNTITDQDIRAQSYTITLQQTAGNAGVFYRSNVAVAGNANTLLTISNSKANINSTVSWLPPVDYTGNVTFTYNQSKLNVFGNTNTQASNVTAVFSVANTNPEISNMIARTYTTNTITQLFSTSTPSINDGPDYGQSYTYTLSSNIGKFGNSSAYFSGNIGNIANTYTFTGNMTLVNSDFANIRFAPLSRSTAGNSVLTYTQSRDGASQVNTTANLTANVQAFTTATYTYTSNSTFAATFSQANYGTANIVVVGGGGAGAGPNCVSGGGGAGNFANIENQTLDTSTVNIVVGQGGKSGNATANTRSHGGNSSGPVINAAGGQTGVSLQTEWGQSGPWEAAWNNYYIGQTMPTNGNLLYAGSSGSTSFMSNPQYIGGRGFRTISPGTRYAMGGGAGAGGNGTNGTVSLNIGYPGVGGAGITYDGTTYCVGGPGNTTGASSTPGSGGAGAGTYQVDSHNFAADGINGIVIINIT